jgi:hypothetical protein
VVPIAPLKGQQDQKLTWYHGEEALGVLDVHALLKEILEPDFLALVLFFEIVPW